VCCERICGNCDIGCDTEDVDLSTCGDSQPLNATANSRVSCCNGYYCCEVCCETCVFCSTNENGEQECRNGKCNCKCCREVQQRACEWQCSQCYSPFRTISYPIDANNRIVIREETDCGSDQECRDDFYYALVEGSQHNVWYNPEKKTDYVFSVQHAWWKWLITGLLSVPPVLLSYMTFVTCFSCLMCMCWASALVSFTDLWQYLLRDYMQWAKRNHFLMRMPKQTLVSSIPSDGDEDSDEPKSGEHSPRKGQDQKIPYTTDHEWGLEMHRELLVAPLLLWDANAIVAWIHLMGWDEYKSDLEVYTGGDFLSSHYFNDSEAIIDSVRSKIFRDESLPTRLFLSALRCARLYHKALKKSPPVFFWDMETIRQFLREEDLLLFEEPLEQKHAHLFFLLELTPSELCEIVDTDAGQGKEIHGALRRFLKRLPVDCDSLEIYVNRLDAGEDAPSFELIENICVTNKVISLWNRKGLPILTQEIGEKDLKK